VPVLTYYHAPARSRLADGQRPGLHYLASRSLPLGARVRITDPATGRTLVLTVRDWCPRRGVVDVDERDFARLVGKGWRVRGRAVVRVRRVR
jgi:rare lipoprotein A (peptidoglycan hydrolase)